MELSFKQIVANLRATEEKTVLDSVNYLAGNGKPESVQPLIECYFSTISQPVKKRILELFCDIKDSRAAAPWVETMMQHTRNDGFRELLSCCWQSSIGFQHHLASFAEIALSADLYTSIEAITVIESNIAKASHNDIIQMSSKLRNSIPAMSPEKQRLIGSFLAGYEL
ncbi:MAG: hypothetical protein KBB11_03170 [Bacteroidales bacterium]|nr:hypothetical protein [Bacteroidales bacterium]HQP03635.1 hypothetical protein [Bacteroidales bacterium]